MDNVQRMVNYLSESAEHLSPLLILTHDYPDPDALASACAFQYLAEQKFGIKSRIAYGGIIGRMENQEMVRSLKLPVHKLRPSDLNKYPNVVLVDTQPAFGNNSFPKKRKATIVIDQHGSVRKPNAEFALIDPDLGATSVFLAQVLLSLKLAIPQNLATALVYGILTDTQNLYRAANPLVITTYTSLLPLCNLKKLARIQNPSRSRKFFETLLAAIQRAVVQQRLIVTHLGPVETPDLVAQIADFLLTYKGMHWSFCTGRFGGNLHVSLRMARSGGRAGEILRDIFLDRGHAGGHGRIAGGTIKISQEAAEDVWISMEQTLTQRLARRLRVPAKTKPTMPFTGNMDSQGGPS